MVIHGTFVKNKSIKTLMDEQYRNKVNNVIIYNNEAKLQSIIK